jgi:glucose/arabinose dehydrogenase
LRAFLLALVLAVGAVAGFLAYPTVVDRPYVGAVGLSLVAVASFGVVLLATSSALCVRRSGPRAPLVFAVTGWGGLLGGFFVAPIFTADDPIEARAEDAAEEQAGEGREVEDLITMVYQLRSTTYELPDAVRAATNPRDSDDVLAQVAPLEGDRHLVTVSPQLERFDPLERYDNLPSQDEVGAMQAWLLDVELGADGAEVIDRVELPDISRVRGILVDDAGESLYVSNVGIRRDCVALEVHRFDLDIVDLAVSDGAMIFESTPCLEGDRLALHQAGGRLATDVDGTLLVTIGDFGMGPSHEAGSYFQEWTGRPDEMIPPATYGTVVRIDPDDGADEIVATGMRNAQGLTVDTATGDIWQSEHGPGGGDELNLVVPGEDYGWPDVTYGVPYGTPLPEGDWEPGRWGSHHEGFTRPRFVWHPAIAPSQLVVYRGEEFDAWKGDLIVGTLGSQSLHRLRVHGDHVVFEEPVAIGHSLRDLTIDDRGRLVMGTDGAKLVRVELGFEPEDG